MVPEEIGHFEAQTFFIPLTMLIISCFVLNLSLTAYSDTVAQINKLGMGLTLFVIALCLSYDCRFRDRLPEPQKPKNASVVWYV